MNVELFTVFTVGFYFVESLRVYNPGPGKQIPTNIPVAEQIKFRNVHWAQGTDGEGGQAQGGPSSACLAVYDDYDPDDASTLDDEFYEKLVSIEKAKDAGEAAKLTPAARAFIDKLSSKAQLFMDNLLELDVNERFNVLGAGVPIDLYFDVLVGYRSRMFEMDIRPHLHSSHYKKVPTTQGLIDSDEYGIANVPVSISATMVGLDDTQKQRGLGEALFTKVEGGSTKVDKAIKAEDGCVCEVSVVKTKKHRLDTFNSPETNQAIGVHDYEDVDVPDEQKQTYKLYGTLSTASFGATGNGIIDQHRNPYRFCRIPAKQNCLARVLVGDVKLDDFTADKHSGVYLEEVQACLVAGNKGWNTLTNAEWNWEYHGKQKPE